jgi:hypothetical protein
MFEGPRDAVIPSAALVFEDNYALVYRLSKLGLELRAQFPTLPSHRHSIDAQFSLTHCLPHDPIFLRPRQLVTGTGARSLFLDSLSVP